VSIVIGAFADMGHLPHFDNGGSSGVTCYAEDSSGRRRTLPYFPNLVEAVPGEFNATPFVMAHNIPFHELQARVASYIWPHSIKIPPDQSEPYTIPNDTFFNSQVISQNCMSKPTKEDNDANLLAMENRIFDRLMDAMQNQSHAMYAFVDRHVHHFYNSCDNAQPLHNSIAESRSNPPLLNEPTIQETPNGDKISSNLPRLDL
jgi:hypothetical protein